MDVWVRKCSSFEEERRADREFWQRMTPDERVAVVEELRREWWELHGDGGPQRLRRAVRVLEPKAENAADEEGSR